jgi:SAM-dependent methyltransferase
MTRPEITAFLDAQASESDRWRRKNLYYYEEIERIVRFHVPPESSVLEIGCGTGDLLAALAPSRGVGCDISPKAVEIARSKHPTMTFDVCDAEALPVSEPFDYVILSDVIGYLDDVQRVFERMNHACGPRTRVILTYFNYLWEPVLILGEKTGRKRPQPDQNWLALDDLQNLLSLAGFQTISKGYKVLLPVGSRPVILCNRVLANLPVIRNCVW